MSKYLLMNKDNVIGEFEFVQKRLGVKTVEKEKLNIDTSNMNESIGSWLKTRKVPKNREFISDLLQEWNLSDDEIYVQLSHAISLNDTLWVKQENENLNWSQVNPYTNELDDTIAHYAFTGEGLQRVQLNTASPELGTNGMLPKCWKRYDEDIYLIKGGTSGYSNAGKEPYSEYYACQILQRMGIKDYVDYDLMKYHGILASKCKLFTDENTGYTPMIKLLIKQNCTDIVDYIDFLSKEDYKSIMNMFLFDSIICNSDRHLNNFGFLMDNDKLEIKKLAPIFDNGLGLFPYWIENQNIVEYSGTKQHCLLGSFIKTGKEALTTENSKMVRNLIDFKFKKHPKYNLSDERLDTIEKFIQYQVHELLKGEKNDKQYFTTNEF